MRDGCHIQHLITTIGWPRDASIQQVRHTNSSRQNINIQSDTSDDTSSAAVSLSPINTIQSSKVIDCLSSAYLASSLDDVNLPQIATGCMFSITTDHSSVAMAGGPSSAYGVSSVAAAGGP